MGLKTTHDIVSITEVDCTRYFQEIFRVHEGAKNYFSKHWFRFLSKFFLQHDW